MLPITQRTLLVLNPQLAVDVQLYGLLFEFVVEHTFRYLCGDLIDVTHENLYLLCSF